MTRGEIMALTTGTKTDMLIAELCGWTRLGVYDDVGAIGKHPLRVARTQIPRYSTCCNAVSLMQREITKKDRYDYVNNLIDVCGPFEPDCLIEDGFIALAFATPLDRCKARLLMERN